MFIPPAGFPFSTYTPPDVTTLGPPPIVLADVIDRATGDAASFLAGADPIDAALGWQFTVRQGSGAALGTNGHRLHTITKATPQARVQLADEARRVGAKFEARGQLADVAVSASVTDGGTATGLIEMRARNVPAERAAQLPTFGGL